MRISEYSRGKMSLCKTCQIDREVTIVNSKKKSINDSKRPMNNGKPVQTSRFASADMLDTVKEEEVHPKK